MTADTALPRKTMADRDSSLDLIRLFAFFSIVSQHFFLKIHIYQEPVIGRRMFIMILLQVFFLNCVPLFLMLSGYLLNRRTFSPKHYVKIIDTLLIYIACGIPCLIYAGSKIHTPPTVHSIIAELLNFSAPSYGWYIEMYIGLFLIIPFVNIVYHHLTGKKQKQILLAIGLFMTALPSAFNERLHIIPSFWEFMYPVTYYLIGAYFSEYSPRIKTRYLIILLGLHLTYWGIHNYTGNLSSLLVQGPWFGWRSLCNTITAVCVFLIIKKIDTRNWNSRLKQVLKYLSSLCLGAYLLSWIFDDFYYSVLNARVSVMVLRLNYFPLMVLLVGISSLCASAVITFLCQAAAKYIHKLLAKLPCLQ